MPPSHFAPHAGLRLVLRCVAWLGLILLQGSAAADDHAGWQLRHTDEATGTRVYLRERGDEAPEFRAITRMPARLSTLVAVLLDTDHMPDWVYRTRRVTRLETSGPANGPLSGISQVITAMPWPLRDRESIVAWRLSQQPRNGVVTIEGHSAPEHLPPDDKFVRMPTFESRWQFTPLGGGMVEVRFEGQGNPGGSLELPLLRNFVYAAVWEAPLQTVNALRQMVTRPAYRDAEFPFIREPAD